jgi:cupin-like protein
VSSLPDSNNNSLELLTVEKLISIDQKTFSDRYFKPLKPVVIKDVSNTWPACKKWTPEFFKDQYGDKQVKVYDASFVAAGSNYMSSAKVIPLKNYIEQVMTKSQDLRMFLYNIKSEIPELVNDIEFPSLVKGISKSFVFMFFGCKGSVTQMHFDIDMSHVFHTAIRGKKTVYLFPYEQSKSLHRYPFTCRSYVDIEKPDFEKFPALKKAKGYKVQIEAGDTLYIPAGYWHHFVYDEAGYSVSLRCANQTLLGKCHGLYNLFIMQTIDRLMNKLSSNKWFEWKEQKALN